MEQISFLGIGVGSGQDKMGLEKSALQARKYFPKNIPILDLGDVQDFQIHQKLHWLRQLREDRARPYVQAQSEIIESLRQNHFHISWGGDHSVGLASV